MTTQPIDRERRLALLLADGSGNFDFVRIVQFEDSVILEGRVGEYGHKRRAEELAEYVGFHDIKNAIRIVPDETH
jgi:hypothetical protein